MAMMSSIERLQSVWHQIIARAQECLIDDTVHYIFRPVN